MDSRQDQSSDMENAGEVLDSLGMPKDSANDVPEDHESEGNETTNDPLYVQKRLKQQKRVHDREMRDMQARLNELHSKVAPSDQTFNQNINPNGSQTPPMGSGSGNLDESIQRAVSYALNLKDQEERKQKEAKSAQEVSRQYGELQKHLDQTADKYDDFDDRVRGEDIPFTAHMRDAALLLPKSGPGSAGEVLYKLSAPENRDDLERIAKLHPLQQANEMVKLSHALVSGGESKGSSTRPQLGQIKSNPVTNSQGVNEKTPPSSIRALMKAGKFK